MSIIKHLSPHPLADIFPCLRVPNSMPWSKTLGPMESLSRFGFAKAKFWMAAIATARRELRVSLSDAHLRW